MHLFFEIKTDADVKLMQAYDEAVTVFRDAVAQAMEKASSEEPLLLVAAQAMRLRPLPSEANSDVDALRRLALSSLTVEKVFAAIGNQDCLKSIVQVMRDTGKTTTSRPDLKPLTQAVLQVVGGIKGEVAEKMSGLDFASHIAALKKTAPTAKGAKPPAP